MDHYKQENKLVERVNRLIKNSSFIFTARAVDSIGGLIVVALLTRYLGLEKFGEYTWIVALIIVFQPLVNFELDKIIIREVSKEKTEAGKYAGAALILKWFLLAIFILIVMIILMVKDFPSETAIAIFLTLCSETFYHHAMVFQALFNGFERMEYEALLTIIFRGVFISSIVIIYILDLGFLAIFLALMVANLLKAGTGFIVSWRKFPRPILMIDPSLWKFFLKEASFLTLAAFLTLFTIKINIFLLKFLKDSQAVGLFQVPHALIMQLQILPMAFVGALFPVLSNLEKYSRHSLIQAYEKAFKILLIVSLPLSFFLTILSPEILLLLMGKGPVEAILTVKILAWAMGPLFLICLFSYLLIAINQQRSIYISSLIGLVINLVLGLIFIPGLGPIGAAIASLTAYMAIFIVLFYAVAKNLPGISCLMTSTKPILSLIFMGSIFYYFRAQNIFIMVSISLIIYIGTLVLLRVFTPQDINIIKRVILAGHESIN